MHTHTHTHVYKRIDVQIHTHMHMYTYIHVRAHTHIHIYTGEIAKFIIRQPPIGEKDDFISYIHTHIRNVHMNTRKHAWNDGAAANARGAVADAGSLARLYRSTQSNHISHL